MKITGDYLGKEDPRIKDPLFKNLGPIYYGEFDGTRYSEIWHTVEIPEGTNLLDWILMNIGDRIQVITPEHIHICNDYD